MKRYLPIAFLACLFLAAIVVFLTLRSTGGLKHGVRVASVLILEGQFKTYGENVRAGINLAAEEIEKANGVRVDVSFRSFDGDPSKALEAVRTAVERDGFQFIVEVFGTAAALNVADFVNEQKVLTISGVNTGDQLTSKMGKYFFRIVPSDSEAVQALLVWAKELGAKRAAILAVTTDWGKGLADMVGQYAPRAGIEVIRQSVDKAHTVFAPQVAALKDAQVNVVFLALNPDQAGNFVRAARTAGYAPMILGTDNLTAGEFTATAGDAAAGVRYVLPPAASASATRSRTVEALRQKLQLGQGEEPHPFALYGYDEMWLMYRAIKAGGGDPTQGAEFLESYRGEGATGPIQFTKTHDVMLSAPYRRMIIETNGPEKVHAIEAR